MLAAHKLELEQTLRARLQRFFALSTLDRLAKPVARQRLNILDVIERLNNEKIEGVFFGGFLRDLLLKPGHFIPRDVDIVVDGCSPEDLQALFSDFPHRRTRFGGLRFDHGITFDIWPLIDTWAFKQLGRSPSFAELPRTTFLNIEAVVAGVATPHSNRRSLFSAGFFEAVTEELLDINLEMNPYPALCVIRSLTMAAQLKFSLSRQLATYIVDHSRSSPPKALLEAQRSHYGVDRFDKETIAGWIKGIGEQLDRGESRIELTDRQSEFWSGAVGDRSQERPHLKRVRRSPKHIGLQEELPF
jgi:hypothetical protein